MSGNDLDPLARKSVTLHAAMGPGEESLFRHLQRTRATVRHVWPPPERIGEDADLVLCEYDPGLANRLSWMPGEPRAALIVLLPQVGRVDLRGLRVVCPDAVLQRPWLPQAIDVALVLALDHFSYGERLRQRIQRMDENIHAMRTIELAKHQIMEKNGVGDAEAFRILRTMAMQRRATVAAIAARLVDSIDIPP